MDTLAETPMETGYIASFVDTGITATGKTRGKMQLVEVKFLFFCL